jgi:5'-3' exonuclease
LNYANLNKIEINIYKFISMDISNKLVNRQGTIKLNIQYNNKLYNYTVNINDCLHTILKNYDSKRFFYDGQRISNNLSPKDLDMIDGDIIDICDSQTGGGIPFLFGNYYRKFKKEKELMINLHELADKKVKYLFFDFNSLIHPCAQQILSTLSSTTDGINTDSIEEAIIENCINYTSLMINKVRPDFTWIVIDGVAPKAKIVQQRERRYKSHFLKCIDNGRSLLWDTNKITPGTLFMKKLENALKFSLPNVFISGSNIPGEGEHKMMYILNNLEIPLKNHEKVLIYGLDGDLLFISMLNKYYSNIILIRDTSLNADGLDFVNISNLKNYIYTDILNVARSENKVIQSNKDVLIQDYTVLSFLLGNDFLDKQLCLNIKEHGVDIITKSYIKAYKGKNLVQEIMLPDDDMPNSSDTHRKQINLQFLKDIFYQLRFYESYYFSDKKKINNFPIKGITLDQINEQNNNFYETEDSYPDDKYSRLYFYNDIQLRNSTRPNGVTKQNYYMYYGIKDTENACFNYIEGIHWVLEYYTGHTHNNWSWYYKYHISPMFEDLFEYLNRRLKNNETTSNIFLTRQDYPMNVIKQLSLVLPKESFTNIECDFSTSQKQLELINILSKLGCFSNRLIMDIIDKEYLWQSKVFFTHFDDSIIDNIIDIII